MKGVIRHLKSADIFQKNYSRNKFCIETNNTSPARILDHGHQKWILIGAAVSLEKEIDLIRKYQKEGWKIAVADAAAAITIKSHILPDIIFSCEIKPYPFFFHLRKSSLFMHISVFMPVFAHPYQIKQLLKKGFGKFCFFNYDGIRPAHPGLFSLPAGGNVFNAMLVFFGGFKNIHLLLAGSDYTVSNYKMYAKGASGPVLHEAMRDRLHSIENHYFSAFQKIPRIYLPNGGRTTPQFYRCREWMQQYLVLLQAENPQISIKALFLTT